MEDHIVNSLDSNPFLLIKHISANKLDILLKALAKINNVIFIDMDKKSLDAFKCQTIGEKISFYTPNSFLLNVICNGFSSKDIVIFNNSEIYNIYYETIWGIWCKKYNKNISKLLLLTENNILDNKYFVFDKDNTKCYPFDKEYKVEYCDKIYPPNNKDIFDKLSKVFYRCQEASNKKENWLILLPNTDDANNWIDKTRRAYPDIEIIVADGMIDNIDNHRLFQKTENDRVIVTNHSTAELLPLEPVNIIFDLLLESKNNKTSYVSQNKANKMIRKIANKGIVYRFTKKDYFNKLNKVEISSCDYDEKLKIFAMLYPDYINVMEDQEDMYKYLKNINALKINSDSDKIKIIMPLSIQGNCFLFDQDKKNQDFFPAFTAVCLGELIEERWLLKNHKTYPDIFTIYLEIFNKFLKDFDNIDVEREEVETWGKNNDIHFQAFWEWLLKFKYLVQLYSQVYDIKISPVEDITLAKYKEDLQKYYHNNIYQNYNKSTHSYNNNLGHKAQIDMLYGNENVIYPDRILSFYQVTSMAQNNNFIVIYNFISL